MKKFGSYLATYEMAQIDAFKAAKFKLSEMIDNAEDKNITISTTCVMAKNAITKIVSVTKKDNEIVFFNDEGNVYYLDELSMNDVIEIVANIVLKIS